MDSNTQTHWAELLFSAFLLTLSLVGFFLRWTAIEYVAPLGVAAYAPLLFIPMFQVSFHVLLGRIASALGFPLQSTSMRIIHVMLFVLLVYGLHPAEPAVKVGIGFSVGGTIACVWWCVRTWLTQRSSQGVCGETNG